MCCGLGVKYRSTVFISISDHTLHKHKEKLPSSWLMSLQRWATQRPPPQKKPLKGIPLTKIIRAVVNRKGDMTTMLSFSSLTFWRGRKGSQGLRTWCCELSLKGHLELVPASLYFVYLTLLSGEHHSRALNTSPKGVYFRESCLYPNIYKYLGILLVSSSKSISCCEDSSSSSKSDSLGTYEFDDLLESPISNITSLVTPFFPGDLSLCSGLSLEEEGAIWSLELLWSTPLAGASSRYFRLTIMKNTKSIRINNVESVSLSWF